MPTGSQGMDEGVGALTELKLKIPADLYRAFQRCTWILVHESGRSQLDVMREMVDDFLRKHGC